MKSIGDNIIVEVDKQFEDTLTTKSGLELHIDSDFNPGSWTRNYGKVISLPSSLSDDAYIMVDNEWHDRMNNPPKFSHQTQYKAKENRLRLGSRIETVKRISDIQDLIGTVRVGDTLWFSYKNLLDKMQLLEQSKDKGIWRIRLDMGVYAYRRVHGLEGETRWEDFSPICGYLLCQEIMQSEEELKVNNITTHVGAKPMTHRLKVVYACAPLKGDGNIGCKAGDTVIVKSVTNDGLPQLESYNINGAEYVVMMYRDVLGVEV